MYQSVYFALWGVQEWLIIGLIAVLLFGGAKLPQLARSMGSSVTQFKKGLKEDPELTGGDGSDDSPPKSTD